ncbi:hypothetical protein A0257_14860 [Hymenobacter psoromatis]|nr:hypothetical protein A0257_14860 [Hymenobacter psoromatis]
MFKSISLILLAVGVGACGKRPDKVDMATVLAHKLSANKQLASFSFCNDVPLVWDSILVVKPYCPAGEIKKFGVKNYANTKDFVSNQGVDDANCTLLFLKNQTCVGYSVVPRAIVDLADLPNEKDSGVSLITKANCLKKLRFDKTHEFVKMVD